MNPKLRQLSYQRIIGELKALGRLGDNVRKLLPREVMRQAENARA